MTEPAVLTPEEIAIRDLRSACLCLYLEVHPSIADDVTHEANAVILRVESLESKLREAEERVASLESTFFTQGVRDALQHFYNRECDALANHQDVTRAAAAILWREADAALQSAQKENE